MTSEAKKAAVLKECGRLSTLPDYEVAESVKPLELSVADQGYTYQIYTKHLNLYINKVGENHEQTIHLAHRLLGLDSRPLVAALEEIEERRMERGEDMSDVCIDMRNTASKTLKEWKEANNG
jgi:hypothetical protein